MAQLTSQEVRDIENGFTDSHSARGSILGRYYELKYQFHHAEDPNGHTLLQRFVYWKSSIEIIKQHVLIGVGIGDVESSLKERYKTTELLPENQKRPHNMFLTTWLICGVFGVLALLGLLLYFLVVGIKKKSGLMVVFAIITFVTMMLEDSLETQAGASFFGLFIGLFCCHQATVLWSYKNH
ncbi:MAG: O-antigen ligase domain-containing protein [Flavobacteriia bacterium]|nr:O-antigen ligase domain-containing protein [Flavobacteriia bacterium]